MGAAVTNLDDGLKAAHTVGYPVLVRPSFVLGGRAMEIVADDEMLRHYLQNAVRTGEGKPVLVDKYISGREVEVDAICDGRDVFVPGIMELVERTRCPLRRLHQRLPAVFHLRQGQGHDPDLCQEARSGHRHRRTV